MELNLDELALLQDAEVLKQKIEEVIGLLQEKGFEAKIKSSSLLDMLYLNNTLRFNLYVSIPVKKEKMQRKKRKKSNTFLQSLETAIKNN